MPKHIHMDPYHTQQEVPVAHPKPPTAPMPEAPSPISQPSTSVIISERVIIGPGQPLTLIAGPCVIETRDLLFRVAETLVDLTDRMGVSYVFKASYEKDNRSEGASFRGPGLEAGLRLLSQVKERFGCPLVTDVHRVADVASAADVVDVLQVPAFLCRQTSLLEAVAASGLPVMIKKGQFMSPEAMRGSVGKVLAQGNHRVLLCERGTSFGYGDLINDFAGIPIMKAFGTPVIFDVTHSARRARVGADLEDERLRVQRMAVLLRCGVVSGCDGLFMETHPEPARALCDAEAQAPLEAMEGLLQQAVALRFTTFHSHPPPACLNC